MLHSQPKETTHQKEHGSQEQHSQNKHGVILNSTMNQRGLSGGERNRYQGTPGDMSGTDYQGKPGECDYTNQPRETERSEGRQTELLIST